MRTSKIPTGSMVLTPSVKSYSPSRASQSLINRSENLAKITFPVTRPGVIEVPSRSELVDEHGFLNPLVFPSTGVEQATFFN
jgi:hypothetical protein